MEKIIKVSRAVYKQNSMVTYNETSSDEKLIEQKELTIKSLAALQLMITALTEEDKAELNELIKVLRKTVDDVSCIFTSDMKHEQDFYESYKY